MGRLPLRVLLVEFGERLDDLVRMLGASEFFYSERASVADLAVYGQLARSESNPDLWSEVRKRPELVDYMKRVEQATGG